MIAFLDTGYFIALMEPRDQWHELAVKAAKPHLHYVTSSLVINEVITLLGRRGFLSAALQFLENIQDNPKIKIVFPSSDMQYAGWGMFKEYGPRGASAVDAMSFAIMHAMRIHKAFTFDQHFAKAGFDILA